MFRSTTPFNPICDVVSTAQLSVEREWRTKILRGALLASVAAGAMMVSHAAQAQVSPPFDASTTPCNSTDGVIVTCTGDVSDGIKINNGNSTGYTTLNINNVIGDITPADGVSGIWFESKTGDVTIIGDDANPFNITTTGDGAHGIAAVTRNGGAINVEHWGDIDTKGTGSKGIHARSHGGGAATVTHSGDIITTGGEWSVGISVYTYDGGAVTITHMGIIETAGNRARAIDAASWGVAPSL